MSIQLQPQKNFAIVRQLPDPSDSSTYYVQAVIRNAETDAIIATVNLEDKGTRRFIGVWRAIADKSGQGTLISIRTSIYTDSNYTTLSTTYAQEIETYLILERFNPNEIVRALGPAMGGDVKIDYAKIRADLRDILNDKLKPVIDALDTMEENEKGTKKSLVSQIKVMLVVATREIKDAMPEIKDPEKVDLEPITNTLVEGMRVIGERIAALHKFEVNKDDVDLTPVIDAITNAVEDIKTNQTPANEAITKMDKVFEDFNASLKDKVPEISTQLDDLHEKLKGMIFSTMLSDKAMQTGSPKQKVDHKKRAEELVGLDNLK